MGKFERKVNKKLSEDLEDFDVWYEKNELNLDAIDNDKKLSSNRNVIAKTKSRFLFIAIGAALMLCLIAVGFIIYNKSSQGFNSDGKFRYTAMVESEIEDFSARYDFLTKTDIQSATKIYAEESDKLLAVSISTELGYGENYYFIDFDIALDESYSDFINTEYTDFSTTLELEDYSASYKLVGQDSDGLYNYLMLLKNDSEQKIYAQVKAFEDDLSGIFEILKN